MRYRALFLALMSLVFASIVAWHRLRSPDQPVVRVAFNKWVGYGPLFIAKDRGFFTKHGLRVDLRLIDDAGTRRGQLLANQLEGAGSTIDELIVARADGVEAKMVAALDRSNGADGIVADDDIREPQDLRHKTVAVQPGFISHFFLLYVLDSVKMTSHDVVIRPLDPDDAAVAFEQGKVNAVVTWEPYLSRLKKRKGAALLLTSRDFPSVLVDTLIFRQDVIDQRPRDVAAFIDAWFDALEFMKKNHATGQAIIATHMNLPTVTTGQALSSIDLLDLQRNRKLFDPHTGNNVYQVSQTAVALWRREGVTPNVPQDERLLIEPRFITQHP